MTLSTVVIIPAEELVTIMFDCPTCGNPVSFLASTKPEFGHPSECPICGTGFQHLTPVLRSFRSLFQAVRDSHTKFRFVLPAPVANTEPQSGR